jgi:hypothetical protein
MKKTGDPARGMPGTIADEEGIIAVNVRDVAEIMNDVLREMVRAERLVHGPACGGGEGIRKLLAFFSDRVLTRLKKGGKPALSEPANPVDKRSQKR